MPIFLSHPVLSCAGNDNIHLLTTDKRQRLLIGLKDRYGDFAYAEYDNFTVDSEENKYNLSSIGTYNGTAGQCMHTLLMDCVILSISYKIFNKKLHDIW